MSLIICASIHPRVERILSTKFLSNNICFTLLQINATYNSPIVLLIDTTYPERPHTQTHAQMSMHMCTLLRVIIQ